MSFDKKAVMPAGKQASSAMDGKLKIHPCLLDSGNPCRNDEVA